MSDCHDLFTDFHKKIYLSSDKKDSLRTSRNALRTKIKKYFKETLELTEPKFYGQGSYMMNTTIKPIDEEYDIDDGIYLQHLKGVDEEEWVTPSTVHTWIVKAVEGHTSTEIVDKNTCVRVTYKANYHIDFPIYVMNEEHPKLAHKSKGWIDSDPKLLTEWFNKEVAEKGSQLKRVVRYFKAWKDNKNGDPKLPSGMILTILAANHYVEDDKDDASFAATLKEIYNSLSDAFILSRPVFPNEELIADWSETKQNNFLNKLENVIKKATQALEENDKVKASAKWIDVFGDRFPEYQPPEKEDGVSNEARTFASPSILGNHGRSA